MFLTRHLRIYTKPCIRAREHRTAREGALARLPEALLGGGGGGGGRIGKGEGDTGKGMKRVGVDGGRGRAE